MRIAMATCTSLPDWEVDDQPLHDALQQHGVEVEHPVWNDKSIDWSSFDACVIRTTWDYTDQRDEFVQWARMAASHTCLYNPAATIEWNTCKSYLKDLAECGIATIPTCWLEAGSSPDLAELMMAQGWTRGFLKPRIGATARGTCRFNIDDHSLEEAMSHLDTMLSNEHMMLQPYLDSVESLGEWSAIVIDGELTHAVRKIPRPGDYRVQDDFGATDETHTPTPDELAMVHETIKVLHAHPEWTGHGQAPLLYARLDYLKMDGRSLLNEVELVEPSLFFRHAPDSAVAFARAIVSRCRAQA